jgi:blue copper oxidase
MKNTRRNFFLGSAAVVGLGVSAYATRSFMTPPSAERRPLRIPQLLDARKQGQSISLKVQAGPTEFFPGRESPTLGYNGSYLGPTIRLYRGDDVQVAVTNALNEDTTAHWHGLIVPGELDGGPHQRIRPGETWRPVLPVRQPAATLFYHSHAHGRTAEQVYRGLAGVLIVADDAEHGLSLPSEYGVDDLPLVIQDRQFKDGRLILPTGMMTAMQGRRGNTLLVNGTPNAVALVPARLVRLRLVNGSNARIYGLSFDDDRPFHWIASEGGLLEAPLKVRSLSLAPAERAEILVDFSDMRPTTLVTNPDANASMMMGGVGRLRDGIASAFSSAKQPVLAFETIGAAQSPAALPSRLANRPRLDAAQAAKRRRLVLNMGMGGMMGGSMGGGGMGMAINGRAFDLSRIDERVRLGDTEIWQVSGEMMAHPFHVHGVHFEVLSRAGGAPDVRDQGLRDTVLVKEPVELLVRFTQPAVKAPFLYHCHILEHEDSGMMGQYATD